MRGGRRVRNPWADGRSRWTEREGWRTRPPVWGDRRLREGRVGTQSPPIHGLLPSAPPSRYWGPVETEDGGRTPKGVLGPCPRLNPTPEEVRVKVRVVVTTTATLGWGSRVVWGALCSPVPLPSPVFPPVPLPGSTDPPGRGGSRTGLRWATQRPQGTRPGSRDPSDSRIPSGRRTLEGTPRGSRGRP